MYTRLTAAEAAAMIKNNECLALSGSRRRALPKQLHESWRK